MAFSLCIPTLLGAACAHRRLHRHNSSAIDSNFYKPPASSCIATHLFSNVCATNCCSPGRGCLAAVGRAGRKREDLFNLGKARGKRESRTCVSLALAQAFKKVDLDSSASGSLGGSWIVHVLLFRFLPAAAGIQPLQYCCAKNLASVAADAETESVSSATGDGRNVDVRCSVGKRSGCLSEEQVFGSLKAEVIFAWFRLRRTSPSCQCCKDWLNSLDFGNLYFPKQNRQSGVWSKIFQETKLDDYSSALNSSGQISGEIYGSGSRRGSSNRSICVASEACRSRGGALLTRGVPLYSSKAGQPAFVASIQVYALKGCEGGFFPANHMSGLVRRSTSVAAQAAASQLSEPLLFCAHSEDMDCFSYLKHMSKTYGASLLGLVVLGYWIQGFRSFPWLGVSFLFKDGLQVDPATMQFIFSSANLPMVAKPIYGIISDAFYIGGSHRLPYLIIAGCLQVISWGAIVTNPGATASLGLLTMLLALSNMGAAIGEVMNDALVAEAGKKDPNSTGDLQSLAWTALATGGVLGSLCGGFALRRMSSHTMFSIFLLLVSAQVITCALVSEQSFGLGASRRAEAGGTAPTRTFGTVLSSFKVRALSFFPNFQKQSRVTIANNETSEDSARLVGMGHSGVANCVARCSDGNPEGSSKLAADTAGSDGEIFQLKGRLGQGRVTPLVKVASIERPGLIGTVGQQFSMLLELISKPAITRPLLWFVASYAMIPTLGSSLFFFQTQELHIDPAFLGLQRVVGQLGLMAGSVLFNRHLKHLPLRRVVACAQTLLCFCMLSDFLLVTRVNLVLGIKDEYFLLGASAFVDAIAQFKVLPFMVLLAELCPAGSEASLFACFMSAHCLANTFSAYLGVALASYLGISSNSFTSLPLGIFIQAMAALVPVTLIGLIPEEPKGASWQKVDKKRS